MRYSNPSALVLFLLVLSLVLSLASPVVGQGQSTDSVLRVGVKPAPPFVMIDEGTGKITGFSIDLIEVVASQMDPPRKVEIIVQQDIQEHLDAVRDGAVDLGIAATSFTSERERTLEFSVPFYQGGLGIATRSEGSGLRIWDVVWSPEIRMVLLWVTVFLVVCANLIWLTERGRSDTFDDRWHIGVGQAMWWTIVTMSTVGYGDFVPRKPLSRLLGIMIIFAGIVLFGVAIGAFSSALTLGQLRSDIRGLADLRNKPVAVVRDTIAETTLRREGVQVKQMDDLDGALAAVAAEDVAAAVHDVALLRYHVPRNAPSLTLVGPVFAEHGYGITFPIGSELRKPVNIALLELMEGAARYQEMLGKWFDAPEAP
ncbi:MAG: transporter substrate-binding domain-containing protein [Pirellulaceae bacterium]|nr:transporter substrate-binding domain-containing protein [Pirellulaceae bacterium]